MTRAEQTASKDETDRRTCFEQKKYIPFVAQANQGLDQCHPLHCPAKQHFW